MAVTHALLPVLQLEFARAHQTGADAAAHPLFHRNLTGHACLPRQRGNRPQHGLGAARGNTRSVRQLLFEHVGHKTVPRVGAVVRCNKGLTHRTERLFQNDRALIAETPSGILNCVGLQNPGIDRFIEEQIPFLRQYDTKIIANVSGNTVEEYEGMIEKISDADVDLIDMNISCPNVKCGGMAFGTQPDMVTEVVSAAKRKAKKPLIVKLSPNVTDIAEIARAAVAAGADALSLINTLLGMRIDIETRKPILSNVMGGLSGPAVFPVAVRMVYQVRRAVDVPILGMGGIRTGRDIVEMLLAGADAVAMGTVMFADPTAPVKALRELEAWMDAHGVKSVRELSGAVEV